MWSDLTGDLQARAIALPDLGRGGVGFNGCRIQLGQARSHVLNMHIERTSESDREMGYC